MKKRMIVLASLGFILLLLTAPLFAQGFSTGRIGGFRVTIVTNVPNPTITIDDRPIEGNTAVVPVGVHTFRVSAPGFNDFVQRANVRAALTINARLTPQGFALTINGNVPDASIFVDDAQISGNMVVVPPGNHTVRIFADGYQEYSTVVNVAGPMVLNAALAPAGFPLMITGNVKGAIVFIDGVQKGPVPYREILPPGNYSLSVLAPGFQSYDRDVMLSGPLSINANLQPLAPATLTFLFPQGFLGPGGRNDRNQLKVLIDGKPIQQRDFAHARVPAGRHKIDVSTGGMMLRSGEFDFDSGMSYTVELVLDLQVYASGQ